MNSLEMLILQGKEEEYKLTKMVNLISYT
jgi:hypothetical protein